MKVRLTVPAASRPASIRPERSRPALTWPAMTRLGLFQAAPSAPATTRATLLRAGRAAVVAGLLAVSVAACSGGGSPSSTAPSVFTPERINNSITPAGVQG